MRKKGYFFIIDSLVALIALTAGVLLIIGISSYEPKSGQTLTVAKEVIETLQSNKVRNLNNDYMGANSILTRNGNITDTDRTLLEQSAEFYYRSTKGCTFCLYLTDLFLANVTAQLIPNEYDYIISIDNITIFNHTVKDMEESSLVTPVRTVVHGIYNESEMFGPYVVEVISWGR